MSFVIILKSNFNFVHGSKVKTYVSVGTGKINFTLFKDKHCTKAAEKPVKVNIFNYSSVNP